MEKTGANVSLPKMDMFGARDAKTALHVMIDGKPVDFPNQQPTIVKGSVMVPMAGVFELLGWEVHWSEGDEAVLLKKGNIALYVPFERSQFVIRETGKEDRLSREFDVPAQVINGQVMLPIFEFAEVGEFHIFRELGSKVVITTHDGPTEHGSLTADQIDASGLFEGKFGVTRGGLRYYSLTREISRKYAMEMVESLRFFKEGGMHYVEGTLPGLDPILVAGNFEVDFFLDFLTPPCDYSMPSVNGIACESSHRKCELYYRGCDYRNMVSSAGYFKVQIPALASRDIPIENTRIKIRYEVRTAARNKYRFEGVFEPDGTPQVDYVDPDNYGRPRVHFAADSSNEEYFNHGNVKLKVEW